jgi:cytochrome c oxidase assembly factor CtaG
VIPAGGRAASVVAMTDRWAHDLEHASMVLAGMLAWMTVMGVASRPSMSAARRAGFAAALLAIWAHIEAITSRPRPA